MIEKNGIKLGVGDILGSKSKKNIVTKSVKKNIGSKAKPISETNKRLNKDDEKLIKLAEIGKKACIVRKESNKNSYINIEQFFTERDIEHKYVKPFKIYMRHRTYQHSLEDFDKWFDKYLHRFDE